MSRKEGLNPTNDYGLALFVNIAQIVLMGAKDFRRYDAL